MDILGKDSNGRLRVIELKVYLGNDTVVELLPYLTGWVDKNLEQSDKCRGIIIGREITDDLMMAFRLQDNSLRRYVVSVSNLSRTPFIDAR